MTVSHQYLEIMVAWPWFLVYTSGILLNVVGRGLLECGY